MEGLGLCANEQSLGRVYPDDFWSFCAMTTEPNVRPCHSPLFSGGVKEGMDPVSIANESDQVTKGHLVDALAVRGDEGRGTLR